MVGAPSLTSPKPNYLPKGPFPNTTTSGIRASSYESWRDTDIQSIVSSYRAWPLWVPVCQLTPTFCCILTRFAAQKPPSSFPVFSPVLDCKLIGLFHLCISNNMSGFIIWEDGQSLYLITISHGYCNKKANMFNVKCAPGFPKIEAQITLVPETVD